MKRLALLSALLVACGGSTVSLDASIDATLDSAADAGPDSSPAPSVCPAPLPALGSACAPIGRLCEYDDTYLPSCVMRCGADGKWTVDGNHFSSCPAQSQGPNAPDCPTSYQSGGACNAGHCDFALGHCECVASCGGPPINPPPTAKWRCTDTPPGCPAPRPRFGEQCTTPSDPDGGGCRYSMCCSSAHMVCTADGVWQGSYENLACP